ncbi:MAG: hypothetical protein J3R72DRAFT_430921 [Linnemannia gamsii]|nr:MAG: hypothetical protein J3R72DRAFT_430921 [Linnemannia gamsii]
MRQALFLVALLALLNITLAAAVAPLFPNGEYSIFSGTRHNPKGYLLFTGSPNPSNSAVTLELRAKNNPKKLQVWKLRNHSSGRISLELVGKKGYYLGEGRSGGLPGAYLGTNNANQQKWDIKRVGYRSLLSAFCRETEKNNTKKRWSTDHLPCFFVFFFSMTPLPPLLSPLFNQLLGPWR